MINQRKSYPSSSTRRGTRRDAKTRDTEYGRNWGARGSSTTDAKSGEFSMLRCRIKLPKRGQIQTASPDDTRA